jgi:hypothetical protein
MVNRMGAKLALVLALSTVCLVAAVAVTSCSDSSEVTQWIPALSGGQAAGPGGVVVFASNTFTYDVWVTLAEVDQVGLAACPVGAVVGAIQFEVSTEPTYLIPASARFRLFGATQTPGAHLNVYERRAGADTLVGTAEVSTDSSSGWLESAIARSGLYVVGTGASS